MSATGASKNAPVAMPFMARWICFCNISITVMVYSATDWALRPGV